MLESADMDALAWAKQGGLLPAVVQDADTLRVLMLGYMSREALQATFDSGRVTFFSRSRQRLWTKGERSGHVLDCVSIASDCDADALLVLARPRGPTCHTGATSCFGDAPADVVAELDATIARRKADATVGGYTRSLFDAGTARIAQKVGEEGVETALASVTADDAALTAEAADLAYHLLVLLQARGLDWNAVRGELRRRAGR